MGDNNIFIRITGETNMDAVNQALDKSKTRVEELTREMEKCIVADKKRAAELGSTIKAEQHSAAVLQQNAKAANLLANSTDSARKRLAEMRQTLVEMEDIGNTGKAYEAVSIAAAKLTDQMGDLQQRIRILSSDTAGLDAAMSLGSGITGTFNAATSAAALLGGEAESLQVAFTKVQAALSILNGVQQAANMLNKDSAAMVVLNSVYEKILASAKTRTAGATVVETKAQWSLNAAMAANPIAFVVAGVVALVSGLIALVGWTRKNAEEQRNFKGRLEETKKAMADTEYLEDYNARMAEAMGKSEETIYVIQRNGLMRQRNEAVRQYNSMLADKKKARGRISKEEQASIDELRGIWQQFDKDIKKLDDNMEIARAAKARKAEEERLQRQKEYSQRRKKEIMDAEAEVTDIQISLIEDEYAREVAQLNIAAQRKLDQIKGNSEAEKNLRIAISEQLARDLANAYDKSQKAALEKEKSNIEQKKQVELDKLQIAENALMEERVKRIKAGEDYAEIDEQLAMHDKKVRDIELKNLQDMLDAKLIEQEEYERRVAAIRAEGLKEETDAAIEAQKKVADAHEDMLHKVLDGITQAIGYLQQISSMAFDVLNSQVQSEMDALEETYTTDAREAARNANKKLISEKEYERKKAELEMRAAKYKKTQTMIDIGLQTALAITTTLGQLGATPWGIAASVIAGAMGAAQLAIAAAKPLAQYEKGRKGGKGEYALVGEKGPELMYVPQGASIVPNNKLNDMGSWGAYGVPVLSIPDRPDIDTTSMVRMGAHGLEIDYDKLGQAMARNMPQQKSVTVNVDRSGVTVQDGADRTKYLNTKYRAAWN